MFPKTSKRKAFLMALMFSLLSWGAWQIANASSYPYGHLVCAGPFIFWAGLYGLVFLLKLKRDTALAHASALVAEEPAPSAEGKRRPSSRFYIPAEDQ